MKFTCKACGWVSEYFYFSAEEFKKISEHEKTHPKKEE